ncbi:MAG: TonB-dependent receptor [Pseudomonadota bacterium]
MQVIDKIARLTVWSMSTAGAVALASLLGTPFMASTVHAADDDAVIEEIIVTSRRRAESVQDVPLSVTAFNEEAIEQLKPKTLRDFDGLAPNVYIGMNTAGPGASALFIRGVGYADIEKTQSPQVGVIVDGIQLGSSTGQLVDAFDIESIEVNRGPQGVLYGKNTIGGNIVVNRTKPQFNEWGVKASAEAGNFNSRLYKARVNVPVIDDTLAIKIGATERSRQGYYRNATLGGDQGDVDFSAQTIALRWQPNQDWDIVATYDRIDDNSEIPPQDPRFDGSNPFVNRADKREPVSYEVDQLGIRVDWDINENMTLHSVSGWHDGADLVNQDFDGGSIGGLASPFAQLHTLRDQEYEVFTQELRLDIDINEQLDVMFGVYYFDSELDFQQTTNNVLQVPFGLPPGVPCSAAIPVLRDNPTVGNALCQFPNARSIQLAGEDVESSAYFGNLNFRPWEGWEFSLGFRYIDEEKSAFNSYFDFGDGTFDAPGTNEFDFTGRPMTPGTAYSVSDDWDDTIIQASARWDVTESNLLYLSYSEGFRSGGFSIRSARDPSEAAFQPEDAFQWEIGTKNEFFDRKLRLNLSYFYLERDGNQFSSIITLPPGSIPGTTTIINNGGVSEISGFELETSWIVNDEWVIGLNAGILDVDNKAFSLPCDIIDGCAPSVPGDPPDPSGTPRNFGDNDDSRQPEWNASVNIAYNKLLESGANFGFNVSATKVGDFLLVNTGGGADQRLFEGGYSQVNARIQYDWPVGEDGRATIALFGKNLTDAEWREQALFLGSGSELLVDGGPNTGFQGWGAPETWGLELTIEM